MEDVDHKVGRTFLTYFGIRIIRVPLRQGQDDNNSSQSLISRSEQQVIIRSLSFYLHSPKSTLAVKIIGSVFLSHMKNS